MDILIGIIFWVIATGAFLKAGLEALGHFRRQDEPNGDHKSALVLGVLYTGIGLTGLILPVILWLS